MSCACSVSCEGMPLASLFYWEAVKHARHPFPNLPLQSLGRRGIIACCYVERGAFLNIAQFSETYPPQLDGVGRVMMAYCRTLERMGHRCVYVAPRDVRNTPPDGFETLLYPGVGIPNEPYRVGIPLLSRHYRRAIAQMPLDVVHAHTPFLAGSAARRIARKRGIPLVATFHSKYYDDFYRATHSRWLARLGVRHVVRFFQSCDEVWTVNERTGQVLRDYGYRGEIVVMPNGTDPAFLSERDYLSELSQFSLRQGVPTLLFVGQMDKKKNPHLVLEACALLRERGMDFQLIMVGHGQDEKRLRELCHERGLDGQVLFTGFIARRETMLALFRRADLLVFPSLYDNAPMVVREAAVMGTPALLVADSCAAEGVEHGVNGFLCALNAADIARGIEEALPLADEVGERARDTIPIPWDRLMQAVLARYGNLIDHKHERRPA